MNKGWQLCYRVFWVGFGASSVGIQEMPGWLVHYLKPKGCFCLTIKDVANISGKVCDSQNTVARDHGSVIHAAVSAIRGRSCSG